MSHLYIPHNYLDQFHGCFIQGIEKFQEDTSLFSHFPNDEAKSNTEHNKPQYVDSIRICPDDFIVLSDILPRQETRGRFIQLVKTQPGSFHNHISLL